MFNPLRYETENIVQIGCQVRKNSADVRAACATSSCKLREPCEAARDTQRPAWPGGRFDDVHIAATAGCVAAMFQKAAGALNPRMPLSDDDIAKCFANMALYTSKGDVFRQVECYREWNDARITTIKAKIEARLTLPEHAEWRAEVEADRALYTPENDV